VEPQGRVVVVTGGGSGIGAALARRFASAGAEAVIVSDINPASAAAVADEIGGTAVAADVSVEADVQHLVEQTVAAHGRIDIYCSNAGIALGGGPEAPDEDWQRSWEVHVMAHVYAARALLPAMLERSDGYIVGTASAAGLLNHVLAAPYGATKAAGLSFLEWLSIAYGDRGVRVSALCPQGVKTPMMAQPGGNFLLPGALEPEQVADAVIAAVREERFLISPHADTLEFFMRKASDYDRWLRGMRRMREHVLAE
jgi:NAD(P)-dependent dehydrogenase (short-subunit alcohol dehydrogenase family)